MAMQSKIVQKKALVKALILAAFIIFAVILVRFTPIKEFLTVDQLEHFLEGAGRLAPLVFMVIYAVGVCLFIPGTVLGAIGAILFGAYLGFVYVWVGAIVGASAAFFIGRYLGRDFTASLIGDKLKVYDDAIERNGFATVLYLRLIYFPFTPMNFGMGLTKVHFWDFFVGTALGITVGTFIFIFFIGTLKVVWSSGSWIQLFSWKVIFSLSLFVFSLFIPKIIKQFKRA
jgi:uncharacterized membrane protein YdjX (TVP38/TMEM64 family)